MLYRILAFLGLGLTLYNSPLLADSFDDAVNVYLKGFEYCTAAKQALSQNELDAANIALSQYRTLKEEAAGIDDSILTSTERGMDSNLKFCARVATDVELSSGTPILEKAVAACERAENQIKAGRFEMAQFSYEQFRQLKNKALSVAPALNDRFSTRHDINHCERLKRKIKGYNQQQDALSASISAIMEEAESFSSLCQSTLQQLNGKPRDSATTQQARAALSQILEHKANIAEETLALEEFKIHPDSPARDRFDSLLTTGNSCLATLQKMNPR